MVRKIISCLIITALSIFMVLGTVGCNSKKAPTAKKSAPPDQVTFQLNWLPEEPVYWAAIDKGFWAEQNLDVKIIRGSGSVDCVTKIATKKADFGRADIGNLILARVKEGVKIKAVATYHANYPSIIIFRKSSGMKEPKDLEGKTLVTTAASTMRTFWPVFAQAAGIDQSKVQWKIADPALQRAIFIRREADAFPLSLHFFPQVEQVVGEPLDFFAYKDYGNSGRYGDVIFAHEDTIAQNPDLVKRFITGYVKGMRYCLENPSEVGKIVKKYAPEIDADLTVKSWQTELGNNIMVTDESQKYGLGWMSRDRMVKTIDIVSKAYNLQKNITPETVYTTNFLPEEPVYPPKK